MDRGGGASQIRRRRARPLSHLTTSPTGQIWAVEGDRLAQYDGHRWRQVDGVLPSLGAAGDVGLAMDGTGGWLATTRGTRIGNRPWTARWDGALTAIAPRGNQVWVAGTGSGPAEYQTLLDRWCGKRWIREPSLNLGGTQSTDIGVTGRGSVFVGGTGSNANGTSYPLLRRWAGQR